MILPLWLRLFWFRSICVMLFVSTPFFLASANTEQYYNASIPVNSQSQAERNRAAAEGLKEVMVRMSGIEGWSEYPQANSLLRNASAHIEQFQYEFQRNAQGSNVEHLVMKFSPSVVENLLRQAELPYWPTARPSTLVWLVEDSISEGKRLVNDITAPFMTGLLQTAQRRGVPLSLPLLDLEDQLAIGAEQVWNLNSDVILNASERYGADTVLVGRYTQTSTGVWWTTWQFLHRGQERIYDLRGENAVHLGQQALGPVADHLAELYALKSNGVDTAEAFFLQISPITSFSAYRKAMDYLQGLAAITSPTLVAVNGDTLVVSCQVIGNREQLTNALSLDNKMRARPLQQASEQLGTAAQPLRLEWIGR